MATVNIWEEDKPEKVSKPNFKRYYLEGSIETYDGTKCPYCHEKNTMAIEQAQMDGDGGTQQCECHDCGSTWYDILKVTGWMEVP